MTTHVDRMQEVLLTHEHLERLRRYCMDEPDGPLSVEIQAQGQNAMTAGPFSVMDKNLTAPSGDKHDFLRMPTYAWPNPNTPDGLPYIIRDGEVGPGAGGNDYDMGSLRKMTTTVIHLAWATLATDDEAFAVRAAELLRTWFLDPATLMNPNLTFAKYTPGDTPPYANGVIATHRWVELVQAVGILAGSERWPVGLADDLRHWFHGFVDWLSTSRQGCLERSAKNNRGIWYDAQLVAYCRFVGDDVRARTLLGRETLHRLPQQVSETGQLAEELTRTNSMGYTLMALDGWARLAMMGDLLGIDVWYHCDGSIPYLRLALDYVAPYIGRQEAWPYQQIKPVPETHAVFPFCGAAEAYREPLLREPLSRIDPDTLLKHPATELFGEGRPTSQ
jgi:hypothetical protein